MTTAAGIIIQARTGSERMPEKILLPFDGSKSILEILILRLQKNKLTLPVIVATTTEKQDDKVEEIAVHFGTACFRGETNDVLGRFINAARIHNLQTVIRVCADNPFFSLDQLETLIRHYDGTSDYCSYRMKNNLPAIRSHIGLFGEICNTEALRKAHELTALPIYLEHVTSFLYSHPDIFSLQLVDAPAEVFGRNDLRLTLDTREDFRTLQEIYTAMIANHGDFNLRHLVELIDKHPVWLRHMQAQISLNSKV